MWEERYFGSPDYVFGTAPAQFLIENPGPLRPGLRALCVSDGEGRNAVHLAGQGLSVTSFDLSPTAVGRAKALAAEKGVEIDAHPSDWDGWDFTAPPYDLVCAIFVQYADPAFRARQFADLARATARGGTLMLHGYTPEQIAYGTGGPKSAENMYTVPILAEAFAGWRILRLAAYERDVQEGRGHSGRSALIDLIAEKL